MSNNKTRMEKTIEELEQFLDDYKSRHSDYTLSDKESWINHTNNERKKER